MSLVTRGRGPHHKDGKSSERAALVLQEAQRIEGKFCSVNKASEQSRQDGVAPHCFL
jgi:hypothetical protein